MEDPLVRMYYEFTNSAARRVISSSDDAMRRFGGQFEQRVRFDLMSMLTDQVELVSRRTRTPDILATRGDGSLVGVDVKVWGPSEQSLTNRLNTALKSSAVARRSISGEMTLSLIILALPDFAREDASSFDFFGRARALLRNGEAGFDRIFIGIVGTKPPFSWFPITPDGQHQTLVYDDVLRDAIAAPETVDASIVDPIPAISEPSVLLVADEWGSSLGGISTFNRELSIGLAKNGFQVSVLLPSTSQADLDEASSHGIALFSPPDIPGIQGKELLLAPAIYPPGFAVDLIVGHGRTLGPYAFGVATQQFPTAKRLHIVHTDAERLEAVKLASKQSRMMKADARRRLELDLATTSHMVAGVGPLLTDTINDEMLGTTGSRAFRIVPEPRDWGAVVDRHALPKARRFLVLGRAEDLESKGLDIAAKALSATRTKLSAEDIQVELRVRGVREKDEKRVEERLSRLAGAALVHLRPYSTLQSHLKGDIFSSLTLLLPSRHEGFGLSAYEAIAAGLPVLVSESSGVGLLIRELDPYAPEVMPMIDDENRVLDAWSDAMARNARDPEEAFRRAAELRSLFSDFTWAQVAADIRAHM